MSDEVAYVSPEEGNFAGVKRVSLTTGKTGFMTWSLSAEGL